MKELDNKVQKKIIDLVSALVPQAKIYLYGSRARGTNDEWSDIDIALDAGDKLSNTIIDEVKSVLDATNLPYKFDVVDFNRVSSDMQESIKRDRKVWKQ